MIGVPVNAGEEVLVIGPAGNPANALLLGLQEKGPFKLPPGLVQTEFMCLEERSLRPCPPQEGGSLPSPFLKAHDGGGNGASDCVPWILLGLELLVCTALWARLGLVGGWP